jgi:hypothetical protein
VDLLTGSAWLGSIAKESGYAFHERFAGESDMVEDVGTAISCESFELCLKLVKN